MADCPSGRPLFLRRGCRPLPQVHLSLAWTMIPAYVPLVVMGLAYR